MNHSVLDGRVALVTGAARGLGLYFSEALVAAGARVVMVARSGDVLRQEAERLGPNARAIQADISDPRSVLETFAATRDAFGGLDVLVNNATLNNAHRIEEVTDTELQAELGVNIFGAIYCMRAAIPLMRSRGGGDIVNISSESVVRPFPYLSLYAASKATIENLTVGLREEVRKDGIRVTTLRSGQVASGGAFLQAVPAERLKQFFEAATAGGYMQDVGHAISPRVTADVLLTVLGTPREAHIDLVTVRSI